MRGTVWAQIALFCMALAFAAANLFQHRDFPPHPVLPIAPSFTSQAHSEEPSGTKYASLGTTRVFDSLYTKPEPSVTPPPTPVPPPPVDQVTADWRLVAILPGGTCTMEIRRSREQWTFSAGETRSVRYQNRALDIRLISVDETNFAATLGYPDSTAADQCTLSMFEE